MADAFNEHFINIGSNLAQQLSQSHFLLSITLIEWTKYLLFEKYPKKRYLHFC